MRNDSDVAQLCHTAALQLLTRPPLVPEHQALIAGLMPAARVLWTDAACTADGTTAPVRAENFLQALDHLLPDAAAAGATRLVPLLELLGQQWRRVPGLVLAAMALQLAAAGNRDLVVLEIEHVAHWIVQTHRPLAECDRAWDELIQDALRWRFHDEIALRLAPSAWDFPLVALSVAGFRLTPITATAQLVDSQHHKGALCLATRRDACSAGVDAWLFAQPQLLDVPEGLCLIGLIRPSVSDDWSETVHYAPVELQDLARRAALSIVASANAARGLARVRQLASGLSPVSRRVNEMLRQMLGNH